MAFLTALSCFIFGVFLIRSRTAALHAFVIGVGTLLLTSPWWGSVVLRHGIEPFLSAGQSGELERVAGGVVGEPALASRPSCRLRPSSAGWDLAG